MTYVLNDASVLPATEVAKAVSTPATAGQGFWQRFYAAIVESRHRSAMRELRAHSFLVNESGMLLGGIPASTVTNDRALPFNR